MKAFNIVFVVGILILSSCDNNDCVMGGGTRNEFNLELSNFEDLEVAGDIDIELTQGSTYESILVIEPELMGSMKYGVKNNSLYVGSKSGECINPSKQIILRVTAPDFNEILVAGESKIISIGDINVSKLEITIAGVGISEITGSAESQVFEIAGDADINHFNLDSDNVTIKVAGSGNFEITANENLSANISGSAVIKYKGTPQITQNVSGSLNLINAN